MSPTYRLRKIILLLLALRYICRSMIFFLNPKEVMVSSNLRYHCREPCLSSYIKFFNLYKVFFFSSWKAFKLGRTNIFLQIPIQKDSFNIHLMYFQIIMSHQSHKNSKRVILKDWWKCLFVVNAVLLNKNFGNKSNLVLTLPFELRLFL